jgi:hypothetical protein
VQEGYNEESWTPLEVHFKRPEGAKADSHLVQRGKANGAEGIANGSGK